MKKLILPEWMVLIAIAAILIALIGAALKGFPSATVAPDGSFIYRVTIDGHDYIKSGDTLTHSASCKACTQREK